MRRRVAVITTNSNMERTRFLIKALPGMQCAWGLLVGNLRRLLWHARARIRIEFTFYCLVSLPPAGVRSKLWRLHS